MERILLNLQYCDARDLYFSPSGPPLFPENAEIEIFIRINSSAGIRKTTGSHSFDTSCLSRITSRDLDETFGPAEVIAGLHESGERWHDGTPFFIGQPRFKVNDASVKGAFPLGFWCSDWEVEFDYIMTEKDFLLSISADALRNRATILAWHVTLLET